MNDLLRQVLLQLFSLLITHLWKNTGCTPVRLWFQDPVCRDVLVPSFASENPHGGCWGAG